MCVVSAVILLGAGRAAHAQVDYRLTAGLAALASDNPGSPSATGSGEADVSLAPRGGVDIGYLGRSTTTRLNYAIMATRWLRNTQGSSLSHVFRLSSDIEAATSARVTLSAGATLSQLAMADTVSAASLPTTGPQPTTPTAPTGQQVGPQPGGDQKILNMDVGEAVAWQPNGQWRVDQGLIGNAYRPVGDGAGTVDNKMLALNLGVAKGSQHDSAGLRGRVGVLMTSGALPDAQATGTRYTKLAESSLVWEHQWNASISHELSAGVLVVRSDQQRLIPTAALAVNWQSPAYMLSARLAQTADNIVMVGRSYQRRLVSLTLGLPINRLETMRLLASGTAERASVVVPSDASDGLGGSLNVLAAQAGLGWQPGDIFTYSLVYTFRDQWSSDPVDNSSATSSFRRQTVMLNVGAGYAGLF